MDAKTWLGLYDQGASDMCRVCGRSMHYLVAIKPGAFCDACSQNCITDLVLAAKSETLFARIKRVLSVFGSLCVWR